MDLRHGGWISFFYHTFQYFFTLEAALLKSSKGPNINLFNTPTCDSIMKSVNPIVLLRSLFNVQLLELSKDYAYVLQMLLRPSLFLQAHSPTGLMFFVLPLSTVFVFIYGGE